MSVRGHPPTKTNMVPMLLSAVAITPTHAATAATTNIIIRAGGSGSGEARQ